MLTACQCDNARVSTRSLLLVAALAAVALALGAATAHWLYRSQAARTPHATVLEAPRPLPEFELVDHGGQPFRQDSLSGHWSILFFGFTRCPDVCPTTLHTLARASELLDNLPEERRPRVIFVSVDPVRDDPEALARYVSWFDARFVGVTGELAGVQALTDGLGVAVSYVREPAGEDYTVDHTAALFLVDPRTRLRAIFSSPHEASRIVRDYRLITGGRG